MLFTRVCIWPRTTVSALAYSYMCVLYVRNIVRCSGVASMEQMEQLLPPGRPGPLT